MLQNIFINFLFFFSSELPTYCDLQPRVGAVAGAPGQERGLDGGGRRPVPADGEPGVRVGLLRSSRPQRHLQRQRRPAQTQSQDPDHHQQVHGAHGDDGGCVLRAVEEPQHVRSSNCS